MKNQINYFDNIIKSIKELKKEYPTSNLGKHFDIIFGDYPNLFSISDKEMSHALDKYLANIDIH